MLIDAGISANYIEKLKTYSKATTLILLFLIALPLQNACAAVPNIPIKHIIILYEENRTFDHYFGTYPGANGLDLNKALPVSLGSAQTLRPFHLTTKTTPDLSHASEAARLSYNNGKMDGFIYAEQSELTMGYYDYRDIPYYWDYASKFVLTDNFFSSQMGPSLTNHLYLIAGQSGGLQDNADFVTFNFTTIMDKLDSRGISWKYYSDSKGWERFWNPLPHFISFMNNQSRMRNIAPSDKFLTDLESGNLADVVWVMPNEEESEHPPWDITTGENYTVSLINSIMQSKYWNSSAIIITWDDYGGFYDHVSPPQIDEFGLGFRVPCLIISPYAKEGFIDHTQSEFASILKFIETVYSIPPLTPRDAKASDMMEAFDFSQSPRSTLILPGLYIPNHYPLTLKIQGYTQPLLFSTVTTVAIAIILIVWMRRKKKVSVTFG